MRESIGEKHARSLTQYKQEDSSSEKRSCVSTVAAQGTGSNNVAARDVPSASQGIIQVFVTRIRIDQPLTTELPYQAILLQPMNGQ